MSWRLAESLKVLREELDAAFPDRSKVSDGSIGDAAHSARKSDHNPNRAGVVCAIDVTTQGQDEVGDALLKVLIGDSRVKYVIWKGRIMSSTISPWKWRKYSEANLHYRHMHISVGGNYDSRAPWGVSGTTVEKPEPYTGKRGTMGVFPLEGGAKSRHFFGPESSDPYQHSGYWTSDQPRIQKLQNRFGIPQTGRYDKRTIGAVKYWQGRLGLTVDGFVGPKTWEQL